MEDASNPVPVPLRDSALGEAFAGAIVSLNGRNGERSTLLPAPAGSTGTFEHAGPVHIITAYNPNGVMADAGANEAAHAELTAALAGHSVVASVGSAPDGSFAEPGWAVLDIGLVDAVELGRRFGQVAIYRWTADALRIVSCQPTPLADDDIVMGWTLDPDSR